MGYLLAIIVRSLAAFRYFPKAIWGGVAVGAVVGLIIALIKVDWTLLLYSCAVGFVAGIVFELIIRLINRIDSRRTR
jgi:hypothetical protein